MLTTSTYTQAVPAFFSWLGTVPYIPDDKVKDTFRAISDASMKGSQLVFDYLDTDALIPEKAAARMKKLAEFVRQRGEPFISSFDPRQLEVELSNLGLQICEHMYPDDIQQKYFIGLDEGYLASEHVNFLHVIKE